VHDVRQEPLRHLNGAQSLTAGVVQLPPLHVFAGRTSPLEQIAAPHTVASG